MELETPPRTGEIRADEHATDADGSPANVVRRLLRSGPIRLAAAAVILPLVLYLVLRPENYGLTPNSLDPVFYSGYATNFDDILNAVGGRHYFVSRWSSYLPMYLFSRVFGPFTGRLLWRLVMAAGILVTLWLFGRRHHWNRAQQFLIGVLVLTMPMFVRAFFTDYGEHFVVAFGIVLVCLCLRERQTIASTLAIGTVAALLVVANPIAVTAVGPPLVACLLVTRQRIRVRAAVAAGIGAAGLATVLAGLLLFRWRYGIPNVYQPSIDFARTFKGRDGFKSPRLDWLWHYSWLFATPFVLIAAMGLAWRRGIRYTRVEAAALILCGTQYVYQWLDQFVRDGDGLEVSYYWSFAFPSFIVAAAIVVVRATGTVAQRLLVVAALVWVAFLLVGVPDALRLPVGIGFFAIAAVVVVAVAALTTKWPMTAAALVIGFVGWTQIGAPTYDPSAYFALNTSPLYDQLYRKAGDVSETVYHEAIWFEDQMDTIPNDASTSFVPVGGWSPSIIGVYAPHVVGKVVGVELDPLRLTPTAISEIQIGTRPILAVYGPPADVEAMVRTFPTALGVGTLVLDVTHTSDLGYRLAVYTMPDSARLPFTWQQRVLPLQTGTVDGDRVAVGPNDTPGIVTFGPYVALRPGRYRATLTYASDGSTGADSGAFDVFSLQVGQVGTAVLASTGGATGTASITFDVSDGTARWEFRTIWNGSGTMRLDSISLEAA